ncbi:MAG TPA: DNA polymerase IV [Dehalococcoidia bacterium]|nr:DNA polymerase IV [Dehalococcoidia bacterium]
MARTIIHADLDAFYASVEQLDNPALRGKPVVVGGSAEGRGVVAAASYEARKFGIRSAMPMSQALRRCPDAIRVSPRFDRYGEMSKQIMTIFRSITPLVEPLSMDEAFLDVTGREKFHGGTRPLAVYLKREVKARTGLTVSIGVGGNKTVAKIASDMEKPDGLVIVPPGREAAFLAPLPVRRLWGIGPKSEAVLVDAGFRTIADVAASTPERLEAVMGSRGYELYEMANGRDNRAVTVDHERKSVGAETTFARDLPDGDELRHELRRIAEEVAERLQKHGSCARTITLKLRYKNFTTISRQATREEPTDETDDLYGEAAALLDRVVRDGDQFRLIGISCSKLEEGRREQLKLL